MRVLITGGMGFLGTNLAAHLLGKDYEVAVFDLEVPETAAWQALQGWEEGRLARTAIYRGDVSHHAEVLKAVEGYRPDVVVHLAAVSTVGAAAEEPLKVWRVNVMGTAVVLELCRKKQVPVIVASSDKAYGAGVPPFREGDALRPLYTYDVSKACQDLITRSYAHTHGMRAIVTRCCNIYGPADLHWDRLVPGVFRAVAKGEKVRVHTGQGIVRREWIYVEDVCRAYEALIKNPAWGDLEVNIGSGQVQSRDGMVERILAATGAAGTEVIEEGDPAAADRRELGDEWLHSARIDRLMAGISPDTTLDAPIPDAWVTPLEDGLRETWAWYRAAFGISREGVADG